mgnify:CR=1 FL=1
MPYSVKKVGNKYKIIKASTGKVVGTSDTLEQAKASIRARYMGENKKKKPSHRLVIKGSI